MDWLINYTVMKTQEYSSPLRKAQWTLLWLFLATLSTQAGHGHKSDTVYVTSKFVETEKANADYYIIKEDQKHSHHQNSWTENVFYLNGQLMSSCHMIALKDLHDGQAMKDGFCQEYYPSGILKTQSHYKHGHRQGDFKEFFPNGKLSMTGKVDEHHQTYIYNMFDTTGKDQLDEGNGLVVSYDSLWECASYYHVIDSLKSHSFYIDRPSGDTIYTIIDTKIILKNGTADAGHAITISDLPYKYVKKHMGKRLHVACVVDENGKVIKVKKKNSISPELDHILMQKVKDTADFIPPTLKNGRRVKAVAHIPLLI